MTGKPYVLAALPPVEEPPLPLNTRLEEPNSQSALYGIHMESFGEIQHMHIKYLNYKKSG